jgi:hypothetical protein
LLVRERLNLVMLLLTEKEELKKEKKVIDLVKDAQDAVGEFTLEES